MQKSPCPARGTAAALWQNKDRDHGKHAQEKAQIGHALLRRPGIELRVRIVRYIQHPRNGGIGQRRCPAHAQQEQRNGRQRDRFRRGDPDGRPEPDAKQPEIAEEFRQIVQNERPFPRDDDAAALQADIGRDRVDRLRVGGQIAQPLSRRFARNGIMGLLIVKHRVRLSSSAVGS